MRHWVLAAMVVGAFTFGACGKKGVLLRDPDPIHLTSAYPPGYVRGALLRALARRGWQPESEQGTRIGATLTERAFHVRVLITYDPSTVWIQYVDSDNLNYAVARDGTRRIHRSYNRWMQNLVSDVQEEMRGPSQQPINVVLQPAPMVVTQPPPVIIQQQQPVIIQQQPVIVVQ